MKGLADIHVYNDDSLSYYKITDTNVITGMSSVRAISIFARLKTQFLLLGGKQFVVFINLKLGSH